MHGGLLVKLRDLGQSVGGDEPDSCASSIGDADKNEIGLNVPGVKRADALLVQGHSFLRRPLRLIADSPQIAGERAINHHFQFGSQVVALGLTPGSGYLQILCRDRIVPRLCGLEKSIQSAAGGVAAEWITCRPVRGVGRVPARGLLCRRQLIAERRQSDHQNNSQTDERPERSFQQRKHNSFSSLGSWSSAVKKLIVM